MSNIKYLSLFSGIGAFEEGLNNENINYELVGYSEFDKYSSKAYSLIHNIDECENLGDINYINEKELRDFNLMTYGFPCQSFSMQGKRLGFKDEEKGNLFFESMRIAKEKQPEFLIAENVKGLLTHDKCKTFNTIISTLDYIGYNNYYKLLNSSHFNIPQDRDRVFIVSIRKDIDNGEFKFDEGQLTLKSVKDILDDNYTNRKLPQKSLQKYVSKEYFTKEYLSKNGTKKLFDGCAEKYFTSSFSGNRIFSVNGKSPTLITKNNAIYYEINGYLNYRERFALQGFRKKYADLLLDNGIPVGQIDKMSGNSITVNVVQMIFKNLKIAFPNYFNVL